MRIFCPTHEASFEVAAGQKILCEITGHALSAGFPDSEGWEFCCNCETFSPSKLGLGGEARTACYSCQNETSKRFACATCKVFSFASDAHTKGKAYFIKENGIEPQCPGCQSRMRSGALILHKCDEIKTEFLTAHTTCPFCLKATANAVPLVQAAASRGPEARVCPKCNAVNTPTSRFCGTCRYPLRPDVVVENPGTDVNRTQLLGSLCPNCSTPIPSGFGFCGECGQAVKRPAPPPPPPKSGNQLEGSRVTLSETIQNEELVFSDRISPSESVAVESEQGNMDSVAKAVITGLLGLAALVGGLVLIGLLAKNENRSSTTAATNRTTSSNVNAANVVASRNHNAAMANTANVFPNTASDPSSADVGRTGRLLTDLHIRSAPIKTETSLGIHFKNAQFKVLDETSYDTPEGYSTWYKVHITNYGCSKDANLGCGKNTSYDEDEGWINARYTQLD